jgi:hypothetical protein
MIIFIEEKYALEIAKRFWLPSEKLPLKTMTYQVILKDARSKAELNKQVLLHGDEILSHVKDILPQYFTQIKEQIKQELNLK